MTSPVRPSIIPQSHIPQGTQGPRSAGQRAFFEAALGKAPAQTAATAPQAPTAHVQKVPTSLPDEPPTRILRPGSLLDIKV